jgi:hypothetical protein
MNTPAIFLEWFALTRTRARMVTMLYEARGDVVTPAQLASVGPVTVSGLEHHLKAIRAAMDPGAVRNEPGVGYRLTGVGVADCDNALIDAQRRRVA